MTEELEVCEKCGEKQYEYFNSGLMICVACDKGFE